MPKTLLSDSPQGISLKSFLSQIKRTINSEPSLSFQWVIAEISDFRLSRHCYMQLLEKDDSGNTIATVSATIWQSSLYLVTGKFLNATGQHLGNGMKVMLQVSANMSERYGLSLNITDIKPEYTLGDMQRIRMEIINRLTEEGMIDLNKTLPIPQKPQRIAVISAAGAAGYGDFCKQLHNNSSKIKFYTCLFAASMQGADTVPSVINALERINSNCDLFDLVVIIRGGGSTSDLNSFDNYDLAANVANCNIPVITGIGHERDTTVLDFVSAIPVKTPTAAAEWIIGRCNECMQLLNDFKVNIANIVSQSLREEHQRLDYIESQMPISATNVLQRDAMRLSLCLKQIPTIVSGKINANKIGLNNMANEIKSAANNRIIHERFRLNNLCDKATMLSPQYILNRGYSITTINGHAITSADEIKSGDVITTKLKSGQIESTVN